MVKRFYKDFKFIKNYQEKLITISSCEVSEIGKMIIDNFSLINDSYLFVKESKFNNKENRIFYFLKDVVTKYKYNITIPDLISEFNKYQTEEKIYLSYNDINSIKINLIFLYISKLYDLCLIDKEKLNNRLVINRSKDFYDLEKVIPKFKNNSNFLTTLYKKIKYDNKLLKKFNKSLYENKISIDEIFSSEKNDYIENNIIVENIINDINLILKTDDYFLVKNISKVEKALLKDKTYKNMIFESKLVYREKLCKSTYSKNMLEFVCNNQSHIGYKLKFSSYLPILDYKDKLKIDFSTSIIVYDKKLTIEKVDIILNKFLSYYEQLNNKKFYYILVTDNNLDIDVISYIKSKISDINNKTDDSLFNFICFNKSFDNDYLLMNNLSLLLNGKKIDNSTIFINTMDSNILSKYIIMNNYNNFLSINDIFDFIGAIKHPVNDKYIIIRKNKNLPINLENSILDIEKFTTAFSNVVEDEKINKLELIKMYLNIGTIKKFKNKNITFSNSVVNNNSKEHIILSSSTNNNLSNLVLSNGNYTVILNNRKTSLYQYKNIRLNKKDINKLYIIDNDNTYVNISNDYKFTNTKAKFSSCYNDIEINTDIIVSNNHNLEIQKINITNNSKTCKNINLISYSEVLLMDSTSDLLLNNNVFINTIYDKKLDTLIANRCKKTNYMFSNLVAPNSTNTTYTSLRNSLFDEDNNIKNGALNNKLENNIDNIMSISKNIDIKPSKTITIYLINGYARSHEQIKQSINYYKNIKNIEEEFRRVELSNTFNLENINISQEQLKNYNSFLKFLVNKDCYKMSVEDYDILRKNSLSKSSLIKYKLDNNKFNILFEFNDKKMLYELVKMYEYYRFVNIDVNIIVSVNEKYNYIKNIINNELYRINNINNQYKDTGSILVLNSKKLSREEKNLFYTIADVTINDSYKDFTSLITSLEEKYNFDFTINKKMKIEKNESPKLLFDNSYGGFSKDLNNYTIYNNKFNGIYNNILANKNYGCILSNNFSGYTYYDNPSEYRITDIDNNLNKEQRKEGFLFNNLEFVPSKCNYSFGYTNFSSNSDKIDISIDQFIPIEDSVKVYILKVSNKLKKKQKITIDYFIKPILGSNIDDYKYVISDIVDDKYMLLKNVFNPNYKDISTFITTDMKINNYDIFNISRKSISVNLELDSLSSKEFFFAIGSSSDKDISSMIEKYSNLDSILLEFDKLKKYWNKLLNKKIQLGTDLNLYYKWSLYQAIMNNYSHSNYYNYTGVCNCKEKLTSSLLLLPFDSNILKENLLQISAHQAIDGDILYWFYDKNKFGLRNRCYDVMIIYAYCLCYYILNTNDFAILNTKLPYIYGSSISCYEKEKIIVYNTTNENYSLLDHLTKAIDLSISLTGDNGIPLMGEKDFDNAFSSISKKDESTINGFILYKTISNFVKIISNSNYDINYKKYEKFNLNLRKKINNIAFSKNHYERCLYSDINDNLLGIDLLTQSFAIKSGVALKGNISKITKEVEKKLYDNNKKLFRYISSNINLTDNDYGSICNYPKGYFENEGYSISACLIYINTLIDIGQTDKAVKYLKDLLPINRNSEYINPFFIYSYMDCNGSSYMINTSTAELLFNTINRLNDIED